MTVLVPRETFTPRFAVRGFTCSRCGGENDSARGWYCRACRRVYMQLYRAARKLTETAQ